MEAGALLPLVLPQPETEQSAVVLVLIAGMSSHTEILMHFHSGSGSAATSSCWQLVGTLSQNAGLGTLASKARMRQVPCKMSCRECCFSGDFLWVVKRGLRSHIVMGMQCFRGRFSKLLLAEDASEEVAVC